MATSYPDNPVSSGYTIGYAQEKGSFRVYICLSLAAVAALVWILRSSEVALAIAVAFGAVGYYFFPLVETGKARLGAGQYGIFIEGFGIIPWRAVKDIRLSTFAVRTLTINELHIELATTLPNALIADWRSLPWYRLLMKLPWSMTRDNVIRINLEPFASTPEQIRDALVRNRTHFGTAP